MTRTNALVLSIVLASLLPFAALVVLAAPPSTASAAEEAPIEPASVAAHVVAPGPTSLRFVLDHDGIQQPFRWEIEGDGVLYVGADLYEEGRHVLLERSSSERFTFMVDGLIVMASTTADPADCPGGVLEAVIATEVSLLSHAISTGPFTCVPAEA